MSLRTAARVRPAPEVIIGSLHFRHFRDWVWGLGFGALGYLIRGRGVLEGENGGADCWRSSYMRPRTTTQISSLVDLRIRFGRTCTGTHYIMGVGIITNSIP